jgi:serine phosphatase RsbU (regulator of sigma subunit)
LEALTGHAVVLEDTQQLPHWRVHEPFAAAVCVPVASPTMLLGTLWVFCENARDFTDQETNLIEITSGRLAADLERHVLLRERVSVQNMRDQLASLTRWQQDRLPQFPPLVAGWDVAGGYDQADLSLADFYNWFVLEDGRLSLAAGGALSPGLPATLTSAVVQSLVQSHYGRLRDPAQLLAEIQQCLWATSAGDQLASMFYGIIEPDTGAMQFATAGFAQAYILRPHGWEVVDRESPPLGGTPDHAYPVQRQTILDGDVLLVISDGQFKQDRPRGARPDLHAVAETLLRHTHLCAREMAQMAIELMHPAPGLDSAFKQTVLVARRKDRPQESSP